MITPVISATGLWTPSESVSNEELVESFNAWADKWNDAHTSEIAAGTVEPKTHSNVEFIEKASGIKSRFVVNKSGIVDPDMMRPDIPERPNDQISVLAEIGVNAAKMALERAGRDAKDVDAVLCAASNMQRGFPAMAGSPLGGGALVGDPAPAVAAELTRIGERLETDLASLAYAWLLAHPANIVPVIGTNSIDRIRALGRVADVSIDRETWYEIYTAALGTEVP